jgi:hypothetical protein
MLQILHISHASAASRCTIAGMGREKMRYRAIGLVFHVAFAAIVLITGSAHAAVITEATLGDFSSNRSSPTAFTLASGNNSLIGTTSGGDRDYVTLNVPAGGSITQLVLRTYTSPDATAFVGIQRGSTFTEDPDSPNVSNLLGYTHFGPGNVGANLLPAMGSAGGAQGFTPPLTGSNFTLWIQQLGSATAYQFDVVATPEPSSAVLLLSGAALLIRRRRR